MDKTVGRRLKLKDLRALVAVAEAGAISKAADQLNCSQSAVSKAISNLERVLGKQLFERGRKGIVLTSCGSVLLRCGVAVLDEVHKGLADVEFLSDPAAGEVRVGCTEPVSAGLMSALINRNAQTFPRMTFHVVVSNPTDIFQHLKARKLDLAITQVVRSIGEELEAQVLYNDLVVVLASASHPICKKRRIGLADLAKERWVLPPDESFISTLLVDTFKAEGLSARLIAVTTHSAYWRVMLVAGGRFLTIVPAAMISQAGLKQLSIKALPIELSRNQRPVAIVTVRNRTLSPAAKIFAEQTRAIARTMARL
jgi:DNA-binding transcriptional LysR family regulator